MPYTPEDSKYGATNRYRQALRGYQGAQQPGAVQSQGTNPSQITSQPKPGNNPFTQVVDQSGQLPDWIANRQISGGKPGARFYVGIPDYGPPKQPPSQAPGRTIGGHAGSGNTVHTTEGGPYDKPPSQGGKPIGTAPPPPSGGNTGIRPPWQVAGFPDYASWVAAGSPLLGGGASKPAAAPVNNRGNNGSGQQPTTPVFGGSFGNNETMPQTRPAPTTPPPTKNPGEGENFMQTADRWAKTPGYEWMQGRGDIVEGYQKWVAMNPGVHGNVHADIWSKAMGLNPNVTPEERQRATQIIEQAGGKVSGAWTLSSSNPASQNAMNQAPWLRDYAKKQAAERAELAQKQAQFDATGSGGGAGTQTPGTTTTQLTETLSGGPDEAALRALQASMKKRMMDEIGEGDRAMRASGAMHGMQNSGAFGKNMADFYSDSFSNMQGNLAQLDYDAWGKNQDRILQRYGIDQDLVGRKYSADKGYAGQVAGANASMFGASASAGAQRYSDDMRYRISQGQWDVDRENNYFNFLPRWNDALLNWAKYGGSTAADWALNDNPFPQGNIIVNR
jgi:hypothetical protein